jgi:hypothetical protein
MSREKTDETFTPEETAQRATAALRVALNTPPQPHSESKIGKPKTGARKSLAGEILTKAEQDALRQHGKEALAKAKKEFRRKPDER